MVEFVVDLLDFLFNGIHSGTRNNNMTEEEKYELGSDEILNMNVQVEMVRHEARDEQVVWFGKYPFR